MPDPTFHPDDSVLNEYLDGELDLSGRAALEAHLAGCQDCTRRLAVLEALFLELERLPDEVPSRDLAGEVQRDLTNMVHDRSLEGEVRRGLQKPPGGARQRLVMALGAAGQIILAAAALIWLAPAAAWGNLSALAGIFQPPDLSAMLNGLVPGGMGGPQPSLLEGLPGAWLDWMNATSLAWQSVQSGLALVTQNLAPIGISQASWVELSLIGLAGTMVWLAGNGILIGSLNRKSRRRNS